MIKLKLVVYFFLACISSSYSQTLSGKITGQPKEPIYASILIKNPENIKLISEFFTTNNNGEFTAVLKKRYSKIYIEITALGYEKIMDSITNPENNKTYSFDHTLSKKANQLEEIIIKQEKYKISEDTVSFNPKAYKDGTEKKVEDLIKKLPGMEVEANGSIKYRGKNVTAVQLDGDDLFGYNYTIGTRNISVDMIEQVQAIDNYTSNPLLKGIENSDNVSVNLKLKKGKTDLSGNGNIGSGFDSDINARNDLKINLLSVSKRYKSFGNISYNNVGLNNSAEDYFSMNATLDDIHNEEIIAKRIIPENIFSSNFETQRANINNQLALSYNFIHRFSKKISLNANMSFIKDRISLLEKNNSLFSLENINYNDQTETIKKPQNKQAELKLNYNTSKNSLLEIETSFQNEKINNTSSIIQNEVSSFNTTLETKNLFWKNKLQYTNKISPSKVLQFISNYSINTAPQELSIQPTNFSFGGNLQKSEFEKAYLLNRILLLGSAKNLKYTLTIGSSLENNRFNSSLLENKNIADSDFQNNFNYKTSTIYSEISATYSIGKYKFQPNLKINHTTQKYQNKIDSLNEIKKKYIIIPALSISYTPSSKSIFKLSGNYEEKTPSEENLFTNFIAENNRLIKQNDFSFNFQQTQNYILNYRYNNLFTSFATNFALIYNNKKNTYLSSVEIENDFTIYTFFQSPTNIENYSLNFGIEKYIKFLNTTIKHTSNYSVNNYKNIVNQSELRNNQSLNYNAYLFLNTAFRLPVNFQNKFNYGITTFKSNNESTNRNILLSNSFKMIVKANKSLLLTFNYDYYLPNTKNSDNFTFLDFEIKYKPQRTKWIEFWLSGKNLLDNKFYSQTNNSDFQTTIFQSSLMPRYFLLTLDFKI
ncbi:hypothetical protein [Flavobacterium tructae]|uniref:hypothetical protein n=1 Tax=Flavobacterium tructae TaxID=1114873 RepID=UPI0035A98E56